MTAAPELVRVLADDLLALHERLGARVIVGLVGPPGCGKSTLASLLAETLGPGRSVVVPMDGFHLAQNVIAGTDLEDRRGAIDTFDGWGYVALIHRITQQDLDPVYAPAYAREIEDPIAGSIKVTPDVPIVITEGNFLLADVAPWNGLSSLLTETWFVATPDDRRLERLVNRHVAFGKSADAALAWATGPDQANAESIESTRHRANRWISWDLELSDLGDRIVQSARPERVEDEEAIAGARGNERAPGAASAEPNGDAVARGVAQP